MTRALLIEPYDGTLATYWNVTFVGDYAVITATVEARDENDAETLAANLLMDYYDLDVEHLANDVITEQLDGVPA
jgi:hypothetical protein